MKKIRFYVIDPGGNVSWNEKADAPESFTKINDAVRRAREIAESEPGKSVTIAQAIEIVRCPVGAAEKIKL